jgi:hypothetical protein
MPKAVVPVLMTSVPVAMSMSVVTVTVVYAVITRWIMERCMAVFVNIPVIVAMSFPVIMPVAISQVIFALGLVIVVVTVLVDMLVTVPASFAVNVSQIVFALRFEIMAVNAFAAFFLIRLTIRRQFLALSNRSFVGVGRTPHSQ